MKYNSYSLWIRFINYTILINWIQEECVWKALFIYHQLEYSWFVMELRCYTIHQLILVLTYQTYLYLVVVTLMNNKYLLTQVFVVIKLKMEHL